MFACLLDFSLWVEGPVALARLLLFLAYTVVRYNKCNVHRGCALARKKSSRSGTGRPATQLVAKSINGCFT